MQTFLPITPNAQQSLNTFTPWVGGWEVDPELGEKITTNPPLCFLSHVYQAISCLTFTLTASESTSFCIRAVAGLSGSSNVKDSTHAKSATLHPTPELHLSLFRPRY